MSIHDFYRTFVSTTESCTLVTSLRRLSLLEDPKAMFDEEPSSEWSIWTEGADAAAVQA